ncbi:MAG: hypothetical protein WDM76_08130 [Limisphaerales bacterium]
MKRQRNFFHLKAGLRSSSVARANYVVRLRKDWRRQARRSQLLVVTRPKRKSGSM